LNSQTPVGPEWVSLDGFFAFGDKCGVPEGKQ
jgi:hypothetical protein